MSDEYYQPRLDFGESADAERAADTQIRAQRAKAFEAAAERIGVHRGEIAHRLAGMLAVYADSPSMRAAGVTGLRWVGTTAELAEDRRLNCAADSVTRALRKFADAGLITRRLVTDDRGRTAGVEIELNMREINRLAADRSRVGSYPRIDPRTEARIDPRICEPLYSSVIPSIPLVPKTPTTPIETDGPSKPNQTAIVVVSTDSNGPTVDEIGSAAKRLSECVRIPNRRREARELLWQIAYVALTIEGESLVGDWIRACKRRTDVIDEADYFRGCVIRACEERNRRWLDLRSRCPPCPPIRVVDHAKQEAVP